MLKRVEYHKYGNSGSGTRMTHRIVTYYLFGFIPVYQNKIISLDMETDPSVKKVIRKKLNLLQDN